MSSLHHKIVVALSTALYVALASRVASAQTPDDSALLAGLQWRWIGPSHPSGRIVDIAAVDRYAGEHRGRPGTTMYVAAATGGVWKTSNGGTTWAPSFEKIGSIGSVAVAPSDPAIVWVGTGEANSQRSSSYGDGVYKSVDSGKTWTHPGLAQTGHIGRIMIHPTNPDIVYVASPGPLWKDGGERGVFKTTDGGKTWQNVLTISEHTGVIDLVMDPTRPDTLYAAAYQRQRKTWGFIAGGVEGGIYRTYDGGKTWAKVTEGLPKGDIGRIAMAVSPTRPMRVYASIEARNAEAGMYRSDDAGMTWSKVSSSYSARVNNYNAQVRADPVDADRVYVIGTGVSVSSDGGVTYKSLGGSGAPGDAHAIWIDPSDTDHLVAGSDPGVHITYDGGNRWELVNNLPNTQAYAMAVSNARPYWVCIGLQDFDNYCGPTSTRETTGILASDWRRSGGGDGGGMSFDPSDPAVYYTSSPYGDITRWDLRLATGQFLSPSPKLGDKLDRWNWTSPVLVSPFDHRTVYSGGSRMYRSRDRASSWETISGDLTRDQSRDTLKLMGRIWPADAFRLHESTAIYGNLATLDESPVERGVIYTGSDDGVIGVTRDGGKTWKKYTKFADVPDETYVSRVTASRTVHGRVYATFDNHRRNDFAAYVARSDDYGVTWRALTRPGFGSVYVIREHPRNANLLVIGSEFGVYMSVDAGVTWRSLKNNMPTTPVHDLVFQGRENDLVAGTHGRGVYILDDVTALERLASAEKGNVLVAFTPKPAYAYIQAESKTAGSLSGFAFTSHAWVGENPAFGATITYYMPANASGGSATLSIMDATKQVVRELPLERSAGLHRVTWDLKLAAPYVDPAARSPAAGVVLALPGSYRARLAIGSSVAEVPITILHDTLSRLSDAEYLAMHKSQLEVADLSARVARLTNHADSLKKSLAAGDSGARVWSARPPTTATDSIQWALDDLQSRLQTGHSIAIDPGVRSAVIPVQEPDPIASIVRRLESEVLGTLWATGGTARGQIRDVALALSAFEKEFDALRIRALKR